jgi:predicted dehydrogenase
MRVLAGEPLAVAGHQMVRGPVDATFTGQLDFGAVAGQFTCSLVGARSQHLELIGTTGTLLLDWPISTKGRETGLFVNDRGERFPAIDPYVRMVAHFARMAAGQPDLAYGLDWSHAQATVLDALFAAARDGATVRL